VGAVHPVALVIHPILVPVIVAIAATRADAVTRVAAVAVVIKKGEKNMAAKKLVDVSVSKTMLIPTGNFGNVKPSVTLTIKDIPISEVEDVYKQISEAADAFWALEAISLIEEEKAIKDMGHVRYMEQLKRNKASMYKVIKAFSEYK